MGGGPVLKVASRIEKRFLGRTEVAVFEAELGGSLPRDARIELRHTGGLRRSGITAVVLEGNGSVQAMADLLASDQGLAEALLPLDFSKFEIHGVPCRAVVELVGASHVAIALPPIRSYVRLYPDQRDALLAGLAEVDRILSGLK